MNYYMTFDIGGGSVKYGIIDENAEIIEKGSFKTPHSGDGEKDLDELIKNISEVTNEFKPKYNLVGVALSAPGAVNNKTGFINGASALPYIHGPNIKELIENSTNLKMAMENDANCAALAEVWNGVAKGCKNVLFVVCGTGIGGAVIVDGKLHTGKNLYGGEFGFMIAEADFKNKKFATWSDKGSTNAIVRRAAELKGIDKSELDGKKVFELADNGDEDAILAIDEYFETTAKCIYNLQYSFDPEIIVIGGAISARKDLVERIEQKLEIIHEGISIADIRANIKVCKYFNDSNLLGAVYNFKATYN